MTDRYLALARRRPLAAVSLVFGGALVASVLARLILGPRGALVPTLLYLSFGGLLTWWLGLRFGRASLDRTLWRAGGWAVGILALPILAFALYVTAQVALVAADLVLPFDTVEARVVAWRYQPSGRGPGSLHLLTADGIEHEMPAFELYSGPELPGTYRLEITRLERLVVAATPLHD